MSASQLPTARQARADQRGSASRVSDGPLALDRYRLHRRLGAGAFGVVWLARDERLDRDVAVKIVPRERVIGGRFEREARATARLAHPGIVTLYEAAADDDGAYLVSELVRGATLAELLAAGRLSDHDVVQIGIALCDALAHAHAQGVVHRDVKPSNVLVPERPTTPAQVAKLTDFGVAHVIGGDALTRTGDVIGTAAYMAPEQAEGLEVGAPADLYALALVLYEALTGVNPVRPRTAAQRTRRLAAYMPPLRRQRRDLPRELGLGIDLALRPRARERGSIENLRAALVAALTGVGDDPGVVTGPWRVPAPRSEPPERPWPVPHDAPPERSWPVPHDAPPDEPPPAAYAGADSLEPRSAPPPMPARALSALATAGLTGWLLTHVLHHSPVPPALGALVAAVAVAVLPRIGWIAVSVSLMASLGLQQRPGAALVLGLAALVPLILAPSAGWSWPLAVAAPVLGAIGLAGAWPALAARVRNPWRRAVLGFTGWLWLLVAESLAGADWYVRFPRRLPDPNIWAASFHHSVHDVLGAFVRSGALAPGVVWALAALILPWLVRGRSPAFDFVRVVAWSAALASSTGAALVVAVDAGRHATLRDVGAGAIAGVAVALAPTALVYIAGKPRAARA